MMTLSLYEKNSEEIVASALRVLRDGGIVAYPTESFYALGAIMDNITVIKKIYSLKNRDIHKPVPFIIGSKDVLYSIVKDIPQQAETLMRNFWPGPLTLLFYTKNEINGIITGFTGKIALRMPGNPFALALAKSAGVPISATSANLSARPPAKNAREVIEYFGNGIDAVIEGNDAPGGNPSTIVDTTVTPIKIIREGSISSEKLLLNSK
jgi:L-threonylcarbamoyladenylate synthase